VGLFLAVAVLGAGAANGATEKFRLLVLRLLREALGPIRAAGFRVAFALLLLRRAIHRLPAGFLTIAIKTAITTISAAVATIVVAVAVAALVAPEGAIVAVLAAVVLALGLEALRWLRLVHRNLRHLREVVAAGVVAVLIAELVAAFTTLAHTLAVAIQAFALLAHLLAVSHDDATVVLGVLQIVLCQHWVAGRLCVTRQSDVLLCNVRGGTANFHVRAVGFKAPRKRVVMMPTTLAVVVPAAAAAVLLLSLPHCPKGSRLT
jgi:hypothetical protein